MTFSHQPMLFDLHGSQGARGVSLASKAPLVALEWHPTLNGDLTPDLVAAGTGRKVWWLGRCGHQWEAAVQSRSSGCGCPYCQNRKTGYGNDLATRFPEIAAQWHPTLNGDLHLDQVAPKSNRKVWWLGSCGHPWQAIVSNRTGVMRSGCPYCANQKVGFGNDLATRCPDIAAQWHPTRNGELTAHQVPYGARRNVWWRCVRGHEWKAMVFKRSAGSACDRCALIGVSEVELRAFTELQHVLEGHLSPLRRDVRLNASTGQRLRVDMILGEVAVEYDGSYWHRGKDDRDREKTNRLRQAGYHVIRVREHPLELTGPCDTAAPRAANAFDVAAAVLGKMLADALLSTAAAQQAARNYIAAGLPVAQEKADRTVNALRRREYGPASLAEQFPLIAAQWHPRLNGELSPRHVTAGSGKKVWWLCGAGHAWQAAVDQRVGRGTGCGFCSRRYATKGTSLAARRPDLAAQWHPTRNGTLSPEEVIPHSRQMVWWLCAAGHAAEDIVANRTKGMVCQHCPHSRRGRNLPEL
ncbi:zinc-ribbon domain-containing protein [Streptomyces sp. NPDC056488]|uniref:zinc-ribbon domain-containing protein n=1 Tax=Streptomyces sp. NPDC056488 TaxID=3345836 RepID=UPI0036CCD5FA